MGEGDKILILNHRGPGHHGKIELEKNIGELVKLADARDADGIKKKLKEIVPEYLPQMTVHENIK